jgi:hypothetical protein
VKLSKQVVEDGRVLAREPHIISIEPGDFEAALAAGARGPRAQISASRKSSSAPPRIRRAVDLEHTPEVVEAFDRIP